MILAFTRAELAGGADSVPPARARNSEPIPERWLILRIESQHTHSILSSLTLDNVMYRQYALSATI